MEDVYGIEQEIYTSPRPRVLVEFVSANPTGPLTLAHGRGAAVGDAIANLLAFAGDKVEREFYVNDGGAALRALARTVWSNHLSDAPLAAVVANALREGTRRDEGERAKALPFEEAAPFLQAFAAAHLQAVQEKTLGDMGVRFDRFFKESDLHTSGAVQTVLARLREGGFASENYGALWLHAGKVQAGERDYVLRRAGGETTYLASDLAYHQNKWERGFDLLVDVWDSDHQAYVGRTQAGLSALGYDAQTRLKVVVCGPVRLLRDGTEVQGNNSDTLGDLLREVGRDAVRFFMLWQDHNGPLSTLPSLSTPLDFDIDLLQRQNDVNPIYIKNPLFAIQSAYTRASSLTTGTKSDASSGYVAEDDPLQKHLVSLMPTLKEAAEKFSPILVAYHAVITARLWSNYAFNASAHAPNNPALSAAYDALSTFFAPHVQNDLAICCRILGISPEGGVSAYA